MDTNAMQHCGSDRGSHELARGLAALGHPRRIEILAYLAERRACCCKEVVERIDLAQSTVSQHLKVLVEAGLVRCCPDRQRSVYAVDEAALAKLSAGLADLQKRVGA
ncbi:MAG TPA: metalloregulator ArsR/SmtB family transcription factor [Mesorhizobium sp.]|jgi:DNA-binding transcriptional ArsR family regulator|nr:metalloregulator ArsR/SmtB family transcription factor [Mesorhizobium sp.]